MAVWLVRPQTLLLFFLAIKRFLTAGGVKFSESAETLELEFGYVKIVDNGCQDSFQREIITVGY